MAGRLQSVAALYTRGSRWMLGRRDGAGGRARRQRCEALCDVAAERAQESQACGARRGAGGRGGRRRASRATLQRAGGRVLCCAVRCGAARAGVLAAGAGTLQACERRDVVAAAAAVRGRCNATDGGQSKQDLGQRARGSRSAPELAAAATARVQGWGLQRAMIAAVGGERWGCWRAA
jgi:predicted nucleic acid-binding protein